MNKTPSPRRNSPRPYGYILLAALILLLCAAAAWLFRKPPQLELPYLTATHIVVMNANTGDILYDKDGDDPRSPSSITKLMSLLLVLDAIEAGDLSWDDTFTVTQAQSNTLGSKYGARPGEVFTVRQLVAGSALCSGCDCLQCLVQMCAGNEESFVQLMNGKAEELGLKGSHFSNAVGLDSADHYMTARDIAKLSRTLVREHPEILDFTSQAVLEEDGRSFRNTHRLVGQDERVKGLKTGTTKIGGCSLVTWAESGNKAYLIVLLDSNNESSRFVDTQTILDILFEEV